MVYRSVIARYVGMSIMQFPSNELTLVSLFAGCGGSSLGYKQAGYHVRLAVEWDQGAAKTYTNNMPETPVFVGDIASLTTTEALSIAGLKPGELDVLDGSPPCQGFSMAGRRTMSDNRNQLFNEYIRMIDIFQPKMFVMENVSGLIKGKMKLMFSEMTTALREAGYQVSCRLLNAWWYGVPQDRKRLIWIGVRNDLGIKPSHPEPTHRRPVSVGEALNIKAESEVKKALFTTSWRPYTKPDPTLIAGEQLRVRVERKQGQYPQRPETSIFTEGPAPTLDASARVRIEVMNDEPRPITIEEAKILQGFPEWFQIEKYKYIGNSVAPPMAKAVGEHLASLLSEKAVLLV